MNVSCVTKNGARCGRLKVTTTIRYELIIDGRTTDYGLRIPGYLTLPGYNGGLSTKH